MQPNIVCAEPWRICDVGEKETLNAELAREISENHPLFGVNFDAVTRRIGSNQILFRLEGAVFDWAVVHLTFANSAISEYLPDVDFYLSYEEWIERCMNRPWC